MLSLFSQSLAFDQDPDSSEDLDASVLALKLVNPFISIITQSLNSKGQSISKITGIICFSRNEISCLYIFNSTTLIHIKMYQKKFHV